MGNVAITQTVHQAWVDYVGIKLHFSNPAFVWTPEWKSARLGPDQLRARNDAGKFSEFVSKVKPRDERIQYLVSAFLENPETWIGDILSDDAKERHKARKRRVQAFAINFPSECQAIAEYANKNQISLRNLLTDGSPPAILKASKGILGGVSDETLSVFDRVFKFAGIVETSDPLWQRRALALRKYSTFLNADVSVIKEGMEKLAEIKSSNGQNRIINQPMKETKLCRLPI